MGFVWLGRFFFSFFFELSFLVMMILIFLQNNSFILHIRI